MNAFEEHFTYEPVGAEPGPEVGHPGMTIAFVGNPNCGKTTLFNAYTGSNLKTANWPGVTVEGKEGSARFEGYEVRLVDPPGTYSLTSYTMEEEVARNYVLSGDADVIIDVVDASSLERSLYLTLQLLALGKPVVVALNMMDVVAKRGMEIDVHRLSETLGAPVIPVSARRREGLQPLLHAAYHHRGVAHDPIQHFHPVDDGMAEKHAENVMVYSRDLEGRIDAVQAAFEGRYPDVANPRWYATKLLEGDVAVRRDYPLDVPELEEDLEERFIAERYDFISGVVAECVFNRERRAEATDRADRVLTSRVWSIPVFLLIMAAVFGLTFVLGDAVKDVFQTWLDLFNGWVADGLAALGASEAVVSLVCDGAISGVGTVLTFLPNIFILFCALAFLEDSGYMSRVAYVMDGIMGALGLSGRAFIPMILGFGCTVPAIMSSRTLESMRDRRRVMLVTPFMSCSARLPIYVLLSGMFFGQWAGLAAFSMYVLGIVVALLVLLVLKVMGHATDDEGGMLLIELPEYKMPDAYTVWVYVKDKVLDYLERAGTVIFAASVIMWVLLNFGATGYVGENVDGSFAAVVGRAIAPALAPFGSGDWRLAAALLAGISAKEVVVSSLSVLFGVSGTAVGTAALHDALLGIGFGPANALAFMTFCLLYVPCIATIATIRSESGSSRYALFAVVFQLAVAWVVAWLVFLVAGSLLG